MKKKLLSIFLAALMLFGVLGVTALADDEPIAPAPITVLTSVAVRGELELALAPVTVTDRNADGVFDIDEALFAAHEQYYDGGAAGYANAMTDWGLSVAKLWGDDGPSFMYYLNNGMAMGLADPVKDGDSLYAFVMGDDYSDKYSFFEGNQVFTKEEEITLPLALSYLTFDESWNLVTAPLAGAVITVDGKETGFVTDAEGKVTVTVSGSGDVVISAKTDALVIAPPVCVVHFPAEPITVLVSVSVASELKIALAPVEVKDLDASGDFNIDEALFAAHEQYYEGGAAGYANAMTDWGLSVAKLWGDDGPNFMYYLNDGMAMGLADPVNDGDCLYAFVMGDDYSDQYTYFDEKVVLTKEHELTLPLIMTALVPDENWIPVPTPVVGAVITVDGKETEFVTDEKGEVTVTVSGDDSVVISAKCADRIIAPPVCIVNFGVEPQIDLAYTDVAATDWFCDAVIWANTVGVTNGKTATTFAPKDGCTRGEVVTFLWRAAGCPEPVSTKMPFTDVKNGAFYYKAVLWAVENGITKGTSATTFSPDKFCTRGQVATFLWRTAESPAVTGAANPFTDLEKGAYYEDAVLWAVENKITNGTTLTTFSPEKTCNRAEIVAFLYRWDTNVVHGEQPAQPSTPADPAPADPTPADPKPGENDTEEVPFE